MVRGLLGELAHARVLGRVLVDQRRLPRCIAVGQVGLDLVGDFADQVRGHGAERLRVAHHRHAVLVARQDPGVELGHVHDRRVLTELIEEIDGVPGAPQDLEHRWLLLLLSAHLPRRRRRLQVDRHVGIAADLLGDHLVAARRRLDLAGEADEQEDSI